MASNPVSIPCAANAWQLVAENVLTGTIYRTSTRPGAYIQTILIAGDPLPINNNEAAAIFTKSDESSISSDSAIDVYIKAIGKDGKVLAAL